MTNKHDWFKTAIIRVVIAMALLTTSACSGREPAQNRLDIAEPPPVTKDLVEESIRQQMAIHAEFLDSDGTVVEERELDSWGVHDLAAEHCDGLLPAAVNSCDSDLRLVLLSTCVAKTKLAVASSVKSGPVILDDPMSGPGRKVRFGAVTEAQAAGLLDPVTQGKSAHGITDALYNLRNPTFHGCASGSLWIKDGQNVSLAQRFASAVADAYFTTVAIYDRSIEANVNAADAQRSISASAQMSGTLSTFGIALSRAAAAHSLVGGDFGFLGSKVGGFCPGAELTPRAKQALAVLRDASVNPNNLTNPGMSTAALLNCPDAGLDCTVSPSDTVRLRLASYYGISALASGTRVEQYYGLSVSDFEEARTYLKQEFTAFARSWTATIPGPNGVYPRYAATASEPRPLPAIAWAARARWNSSPPSYYNMLTGKYSFDEWTRAGLDAVVAATHSGIRILIGSGDNFAASGETATVARQKVLGPLNAIIASEQYQGQWEVTSGTSTAAPHLYTYGLGFTNADKLRVVVGEDGLRCAVEGNIEGASCDDTVTTAAYPCTSGNTQKLSCYTAHVLASETAFGSMSEYGVKHYVKSERAIPQSTISSIASGKTRLYLVKLKSPGLAEQPGNFMALAGLTIPVGDSITTGVPIAPTIDERVAKVLAPSSKQCSLPKVSCNGEPIDARLPLEDELADDRDGVENSWKHYLTLARQAADEADLLGKEYIDAQLNQLSDTAAQELRAEEQKQQAESALQDVQSTCGTSIDPAKLLAMLSTSGDTSCGGAPCDLGASLGNQACSDVAPIVTCPNGFTCTAGQCVRSLYSLAKVVTGDPDFARLNACLSIGDNVPFVTLGDKNLCVYTASNNPNIVCPSTLPAGTECPSVVPATGCTESGTYQTYQASPLGYYKNEIPTSVTTACDQLRKLRYNMFDKTAASSGQNQADLRALKLSNALHPMRIRDKVKPLEFVAKFGGYVDILEDGVVRWSTGDVTRARSTTTWPWVVPAGTCTNRAGLFCSGVPNGAGTVTTTDIAALNKRLFQATYAAELIRGSNNKGIPGGLYVREPISATGVDPCGASGASQYSIYDIGTPQTGQNIPISVCETSDQSLYQRRGGAQTGWAWYIPGQSTIIMDNIAFARRRLSHCPQPPLAAWDNYVFGGLSSQDLSSQGAYGAPVPSWVAQALTGTFTQAQMDTQYAYQICPTVPWLNGYKADGVTVENWVPNTALLDGVELLCELSLKHGTSDAIQPTSLQTFADLSRAGAYIEWLSDQIVDRGKKVVFANVPRLASDQLSTVPPTGAFPAIGGRMAEEISRLRDALVATRFALPVIADAMRQTGFEMKALQARADQVAAEKDLIDLQTLSATLDRLLQCKNAATSLVGVTTMGFSALVDCANAVAQIAIESKKSALQKRSSDDALEIARAAFAERMSQLASSIETAGLGLQQAVERVNESLAAIDNLRRQAKLSLAKAVHQGSYQSQAQVAYSSALGTLTSAKGTRYARAFQNARQMAFFAKRAVEQRLGVRLSEFRERLPLVDAPSTWEGTLCTMVGVNLDTGATAGDKTSNLTSGFIGDYVTKLENFVESYRVAHNFHEGQDVAVISLRDDVKNVRASCEVPSLNLLRQPGQLASGVWAARGCNPVTVGGKTYSGLNCVSALHCGQSGTACSAGELALDGLPGNLSGADAFTLIFGDGKNCPTGTQPQGACGWKAGAALTQLVTLSPGHYRFSWYTREAALAGGARSQLATLRGYNTGSNPTLLPATDCIPTSTLAGCFAFPQSGSGTTWKRASVEFTVAVAGDYEVGFGGNEATRPTFDVTVAAPMLERLPAVASARTMPAFQNNGNTATVLADACEDTDGKMFRMDHWRRDCVHLCGGSFSSTCSTGPEYCYRELSFGVSQEWIESGKLFNFSGFARGNFNYRIDSLALNFVGSGVRNCEDSALPSTCFNAGFVPYSIEHNGPLFVRNDAGADFQAFLFDARVEHARGLALERYLTNPLSTTDRDLLQDYRRQEFQGRPLDGSFVLRVWEEPGVDFESIQDVQLVLNYRYWTRSE